MIEGIYWVCYFAFFAAVGAGLFVFLRGRLPERRLAGAGVDSEWARRLLSQEEISDCLEGVPYRYQYFSGSKHRSAFFRVGIDAPSPVAFTLVGETPLDVFFKRVGLSREAQTGDASFDRAFYLLSDWPRSASGVFADAQAREAARALFDAKFKSVELSRGRLEARMDHWIDFGAVSPERVAAAVRQLVRIARRVPEAPAAPESAARARRAAVLRWVIFGVPIALTTAAFPLAVSYESRRLVDFGALAGAAWPWTAVLVAWYLWTAASLLKGRSSAGRDLLAVSLAAVLGFGASGLAVPFWINHAFDTSPAAEHRVLVRDKTERASAQAKNKNYRLWVDSWRPERAVERLRVRLPMYRAARPGRQYLVVTTRAGRLGLEWIESMRLEPESAL